VLSSTLTKLVLRFNQTTSDERAAHALRAEVRSISFPVLPEGLVNIVHIWPQAMLTMTSIIRVGQSKFVSVPIDEDSQERIFNCIRMLSEMNNSKSIDEIFLMDTKAAYAKMVATEEVCMPFYTCHRYVLMTINTEKGSREKGKGAENQGRAG
jgi:coatomer subunit beta